MSLKILEIAITDPTHVNVQLKGSEKVNVGMTVGKTINFYVAGPDLLRLLDAKVTAHDSEVSTITGNGTYENEYGRLSTRRQWRKLRDLVKFYFYYDRYLDLGGRKLKVVTDTYYVADWGPSYYFPRALGKAFGSPDGMAYAEMRQAFSQVTQSGLFAANVATAIRRILTRSDNSAVSTALRFIPSLVGAMFVAEPARNPRSFAVNLMLLDQVEKSIPYGGADTKLLSWEKILTRGGVSHARGQSKSYTFSSGVTVLKPALRGGKMPMSHGGAVKQSRVTLPAHPHDGTDVSFPNSEHEKEATLLVRWLVHRLGSKNISVSVDGQSFKVSYSGLKQRTVGCSSYVADARVQGRATTTTDDVYEKGLDKVLAQLRVAVDTRETTLACML